MSGSFSNPPSTGAPWMRMASLVGSSSTKPTRSRPRAGLLRSSRAMSHAGFAGADDEHGLALYAPGRRRRRSSSSSRTPKRTPLTAKKTSRPSSRGSERGSRQACVRSVQTPRMGRWMPKKSRQTAPRAVADQVASGEQHQLVHTGIAPVATIKVEAVENEEAEDQGHKGVDCQAPKIIVQAGCLAIQPQQQGCCRGNEQDQDISQEKMTVTQADQQLGKLHCSQTRLPRIKVDGRRPRCSRPDCAFCTSHTTRLFALDYSQWVGGWQTGGQVKARPRILEHAGTMCGGGQETPFWQADFRRSTSCPSRGQRSWYGLPKNWDAPGR